MLTELHRGFLMDVETTKLSYVSDMRFAIVIKNSNDVQVI